MKRFTLIIFLFSSLVINAQNTIVISQVPESTPDNATLYLAGSINDWDPGSASWTFSQEDGNYVLQLPEGIDPVFQGKITRGSWQTVEGNENGGFMPNRTFDFSSSDVIEIEVLSWEDLDSEVEWPENLYLIDEAFFMPQLNRTRRIRILLPTNYFDTEIHYPVLYMHDGQNLFVDAEAFAGEWEVDEAMLEFENEGYEGALIVAIDNGQEDRINEYTPWANPEYGGGEGDQYVDFIVNTLKPFVDENYRSLPDREFNGIMGSSLGGLISHYAAISYQSVFSKAGIFSPSYWYTNDIYEYTELIGKEENMKFYLLGGGNESEGLEAQMENMVTLLEDEGFSPGSEINFQFDPEGQHSEWFWAEYFPEAFEWLYMGDGLNTRDLKESPNLVVYPNPAGDLINFLTDELIHTVDILDPAGRQLLTLTEPGAESLNISNLERGSYLIKVCFDDGCVTKKVFKL